MQHKHEIDRLRSGVASIISQNGYMFSDKDKALFEKVARTLQDISECKEKTNSISPQDIVLIVMRFLEFFGITIS